MINVVGLATAIAPFLGLPPGTGVAIQTVGALVAQLLDAAGDLRAVDPNLTLEQAQTALLAAQEASQAQDQRIRDEAQRILDENAKEGGGQ